MRTSRNRASGIPTDRRARSRTGIARTALTSLGLTILLAVPCRANSIWERAPAAADCSMARPAPTYRTVQIGCRSPLEPAPSIAQGAEQGPYEEAPPQTPIFERPQVQDLRPSHNLIAFMQPSVPWELRAAAMRRMWLIDPTIRDFVSPALDYAHDYNTPGGAPGYALIEPSAEMIWEAVARLERRVEIERAKPVKASALIPWLSPGAWW